MSLKESIRKYALQNAVQFNGKANPGAIIGKVLGEDPKLKSKIEEIKKDILTVVQEVNKMPLEDQTAELNDIDPEALVKKKHEKVKGLPDLPGAKDGKVVTRIPPEPSKYNHLGHALSFLINYMYAKKYHGKCILRFEDTNPEKAEQEYVDAMKVDCLEYLDIKPDKTVFVSDDMDKFYSYAEQLIKKKQAYVCTCDRESMQDNRHKGIACKCRDKESMEEWLKMLAGKYKEGEATLRMKIDMKADNQVLRDPVIFRIVKASHYRQKSKYCVWPMYDFENSVEEHLTGVTHILRSNEFGKMRTELQEYIKDILGFKKQVVVEYGRFNIKGKITQGREIRELIETKKVDGWDDPRLITLKALKRRGILKEAYYELVNEVGLTSSQTNLDFGVLAAINRKLLDAKSHRYFFIENPVKVKIKDAPKQNIELDLHPDNMKGGRNFKTNENFYLAKKDVDSFKKGEFVRLMDCLNFKDNKFISTSFEEYKEKGKKIIHWLPADETVKLEVISEENKIIKGVGEKGLSKLKVDDVVQFERFGFVRLDSKKKDKLVFMFGHK